MAVSVHFVYIALIRIAPDGSVYNTSNSSKTIKESLNFTTEHRIMPDPTIPNSASYPDIKTYLEAEAASGYEPVQVEQTFIVTKMVS